MLRNKKSKVRVFSLLVCSLVAVSVYCYDAVCIFIYHDAMRIHAEGTHIILKKLCSVYNLALIQLICQMRENQGRKLNTHTDIHTV